MDEDYVKERDAIVESLDAIALKIQGLREKANATTDYHLKNADYHLKYLILCLGRSNPFFDSLSERTKNCLSRGGIKSVDQLCALWPKDLLQITNFGKKSLDEVQIQLHVIGRRLGDNWKSENGAQ